MKNESYEDFVEKFKPKKTTDDCYTPPEIYDVVADYVTERFGIDRADMVRPFYPGGDFESFDYPDGCCVVDNPPFSILQRIKRFYRDNGIKFFIFAPSLTAFSGALTTEFTHIICGADITYANGAVVLTAFVTNMGGDVVAESCPDLGDRINAKMDEIKSRATKKLPKYEYPDEVLTTAKLQWFASHHTPFQVRRADCICIRKLEAQGCKSIFGGGLLLSEPQQSEPQPTNGSCRSASARWFTRCRMSMRDHRGVEYECKRGHDPETCLEMILACAGDAVWPERVCLQGPEAFAFTSGRFRVSINRHV